MLNRFLVGFFFATIHVVASASASSDSYDAPKRKRSESSESVSNADVNKIPMESFLISLSEDFGSFEKNLSMLLDILTPMPDDEDGAPPEWQLWLKHKQERQEKRMRTRGESRKKLVAPGDINTTINVTVTETTSFASSFLLAGSHNRLFKIKEKAARYYLFSFFELDKQSGKQVTVATLRADGRGHIAELVTLNKGPTQPGRYYFDLLIQLWRYLRIERVVLMDAAQLEFDVGGKRVELAMRVFMPLAEGKTLYQKLDGFVPLEFKHSIRVKKETAPDQTLPAQDPEQYLAALERLESTTKEQLLAILAPEEQAMLKILFVRYVPSGNSHTLRELAKHMTLQLRTKSPDVIHDFSDLMTRILSQNAKRAKQQIVKDIKTLHECYVWVKDNHYTSADGE